MDVGETLESRVHVARVAQILQTELAVAQLELLAFLLFARVFFF